MDTTNEVNEAYLWALKAGAESRDKNDVLYQEQDAIYRAQVEAEAKLMVLQLRASELSIQASEMAIAFYERQKVD